MSTPIIVLIIVAAVVLVLLALTLPRLRTRARLRAREKELGGRRQRAVGEQRQAAEQLLERAEAKEQHARIAAQEAASERAQAQLAQERAELHERGLADHELISEDERDRFRGTSAVPADSAEDQAPGQLATRTADRPATHSSDQPVEQRRR